MHSWLSERRRSAVSTVAGICGAVFLVLLGVLAPGAVSASSADLGVVALFAYLLCYLVVTLKAFSAAPPERVRVWARREERGTVLQRYLLGTAPGPGVSVLIASAALVVSAVWRPGYLGSAFPATTRVLMALGLVVVAWVCVLAAFAVAFHADNLVEDEAALEFPGGGQAAWADYVYFALSVMTTFGTTDVSVMSREMRRTVSANATIAFVFNTVIVAGMVAALDSG
ncbi:DUF1345 domain-containing protein [Streptomyces albidoflavus]|uniref:DUF1345 domain-containing protein n=1 Tax=Streptomyces albidoflavus TaxID=1886 RepID=UPI000249418D|nr:DUF1345 domain-containing protein [Streptomyces albidoflavus]RZD89964.1 DUF1345 domain-containing protein [Streptomyces albidoflavus]RZD93550.1 DUF1345 domain-containing protein [Streptomyces albidoflavus]